MRMTIKLMMILTVMVMRKRTTSKNNLPVHSGHLHPHDDYGDGDDDSDDDDDDDDEMC